MPADEIDAIAGKRESAQREMERRIVAQMLTCMDDLAAPRPAKKMKPNNGPALAAAKHVLVIGAPLSCSLEILLFGSLVASSKMQLLLDLAHHLLSLSGFYLDLASCANLHYRNQARPVGSKLCHLCSPFRIGCTAAASTTLALPVFGTET